MQNIWLMDSEWQNLHFVSKMDYIKNNLNFLQAASTNSKRDADIKEYFSLFYRVREEYKNENGQGIIEVVGSMIKGASLIQKLSGETDYDALLEDIEDAKSDNSAKSVVIDYDSGGGMAVGAPEVAESVKELAMIKPVVCHTSSIIASAAFFSAAGATAILASPSALVGSIGTVAQVYDISGMLNSMGIKIETITPDQSDLKTTSYPTVAMTEKQRENLKEAITKTNEEFMNFVSSNRPNIKPEAMRGQVFSGREAVKNGLIDGIGSLQEAKGLAIALSKLTKN